jgi:hypothetical protein
MFRVMWGREILDKISAVYDGLDGHDRERLMVAIESLDAQLAANPLSAGESRNSPLVRVAIEPPLTVAFRVDDQERVVRVSSVIHRHGRRK